MPAMMTLGTTRTATARTAMMRTAKPTSGTMTPAMMASLYVNTMEVAFLINIADELAFLVGPQSGE